MALNDKPEQASRAVGAGALNAAAQPNSTASFLDSIGPDTAGYKRISTVLRNEALAYNAKHGSDDAFQKHIAELSAMRYYPASEEVLYCNHSSPRSLTESVSMSSAPTSAKAAGKRKQPPAKQGSRVSKKPRSSAEGDEEAEPEPVARGRKATRKPRSSTKGDQQPDPEPAARGPNTEALAVTDVPQLALVSYNLMKVKASIVYERKETVKHEKELEMMRQKTEEMRRHTEEVRQATLDKVIKAQAALNAKTGQTSDHLILAYFAAMNISKTAAAADEDGSVEL